MFKWVLKMVGIALVVCLMWLFVFLFSPFHYTNVPFNAFVSIAVCVLVTAASVVFAYWVLSSRKVIVGVIVLIACGLIAFPIYGPGQVMYNVFRLQGYKYLPAIGMFVSGVSTTYLFSRRKV